MKEVSRSKAAGGREAQSQTCASSSKMRTTFRTHRHLLDVLEGALGAYHSGTAQHAARVREIAVELGAELSVCDVDREALSWAAWLHDLGKLGVSEALLSRKGPLTAREWVEMKRHPTTGAEMLVSLSPLLEPIAAGVRSHHERWDGSGYPDGLAGEEIPIVGRIVAVADVFDAMTHRRPYREQAYSEDDAIAEIEAGAGSAFDPEVVAAFVHLYQRGSIPGTTPQRASQVSA
jgi:putative nucleotidyltransferase with HDIG domain